MARCLVCDECFGKSYAQRLFLNKVRFLAIFVMQGGSLSSQLSFCESFVAGKHEPLAPISYCCRRCPS